MNWQCVHVSVKKCAFLLNIHNVMTFDPQGSKVVIPLQVQLTGEDRWFRVNISCPLIKRYSERTRLMPTREWRQLMMKQLCFLFFWSQCSFFTSFINQNLTLAHFPQSLVVYSEFFLYTKAMLHCAVTYKTERALLWQFREVKTWLFSSVTWKLWHRWSSTSGLWPPKHF